MSWITIFITIGVSVSEPHTSALVWGLLTLTLIIIKYLFNSLVWGSLKFTPIMLCYEQSNWHMEKQEMEMKWKLETETGNWKLKWKLNLFAAVVLARFVIPVKK